MTTAVDNFLAVKKRKKQGYAWGGFAGVVRPFLGLLMIVGFPFSLAYLYAHKHQDDQSYAILKDEMKQCLIHAVTFLYSAITAAILIASMEKFLGSWHVFEVFGGAAVMPAAVLVGLMGGLVNYCLATDELKVFAHDGLGVKDIPMKALGEKYGKWGGVAKSLAIGAFVLCAVVTIGSAVIAGAVYKVTIQDADFISKLGAFGQVLPGVGVAVVVMIYGTFFFKSLYNAVKGLISKAANKPTRVDMSTARAINNHREIAAVHLIIANDGSAQKLVLMNNAGKRFELRDQKQIDSWLQSNGNDTQQKTRISYGNASKQHWLHKVLPVVLALVSVAGCIVFTLVGMGDIKQLVATAPASVATMLGVINAVGCAPFFAKGGYQFGAYLSKALSSFFSNAFVLIVNAFRAKKDGHGQVLYQKNGAGEYIRMGGVYLPVAGVQSVATTVSHAGRDSYTIIKNTDKELAFHVVSLALTLVSVTLVIAAMAGVSLSGPASFPILLLLGLTMARWGINKVRAWYADKDALGGAHKTALAQAFEDAKTSVPSNTKIKDAELALQEKRDLVKRSLGQVALVSMDCAKVQRQGKNSLDTAAICTALQDSAGRALTTAVDGDVKLKKMKAYVRYLLDDEKQARRAQRVNDGFASSKHKDKRYVVCTLPKASEAPSLIGANAAANGAIVGNQISHGVLKVLGLFAAAEASAGACAQPNTAPHDRVYLRADELDLINTHYLPALSVAAG